MLFATLLALLLYANCRKIEISDADRLLQHLNDEVDYPFSVIHSALTDFNESLTTLTTMSKEFGEVFANSMKDGNRDNEIGPLQDLTSKMLDNFEVTYYLQKNLLRSGDLHLLNDYKKKVHSPLESLLTTFDLLLKSTPSNADVEKLVDQCQNLRNIAAGIANASRNCSSVEHSIETETLLFNFFDKFKFSKYSISFEEFMKFNRHYSNIYFYISSQKDKNDSIETIQRFLNETKDSSYENKAVLFEDLAKKFGLNEGDPPHTTCIPMEAYLRSHYDRNVLNRFAYTLFSHAMYTAFGASMCANVTFNQDPVKAGTFVSQILQQLIPVYKEFSGWMDSLLLSSWPDREMQLIKWFIKEAAGGKAVSEDSKDYEKILEQISTNMGKIGSPRFSRQYIVSKDYQNGTDNFYIACKNNTCSTTSAMGARVIVFRTRVDSNAIMVQLLDFNRSYKWADLLIRDELDRNFRDKDTMDFVKNLTAHDVNLQMLENFSGMVILRKQRFLSGCRVQYALKTESYLDSAYVNRISYYDDAAWRWRNCTDWNVFVAV